MHVHDVYLEPMVDRKRLSDNPGIGFMADYEPSC